MSSSFYAKKPVDQPPTKLREFNVGGPEDETEGNMGPAMFNHQTPHELSAAEREELQRMRKEATSKAPRIGDHARKRIELLANIGRLSKDVDIEGIVFSIRTLKTKETREATMSIFECKNDADAAFEIRRQTLARAINQIDGQDLELALGGSDFGLKLDLIDGMEDVVVGKLYNAFNDLRQEARTKYGLDSEQQAKEVVDDLKK